MPDSGVDQQLHHPRLGVCLYRVQDPPRKPLQECSGRLAIDMGKDAIYGILRIELAKHFRDAAEKFGPAGQLLGF
jgi:hypothetical protein